jgi:hypothetical protein
VEPSVGIEPTTCCLQGIDQRASANVTKTRAFVSDLITIGKETGRSSANA